MMKWIFLGFLSLIILLIAGTILFLFYYPGVGKVPKKEQRKHYEREENYFQKGKFRNVSKTAVFPRQKSDPKSPFIKPRGKIPIIYLKSIPDGKEGKLFITWFGHSSFLLQMGLKNILVDPIFSLYASPVRFIGAKRFSDIAIRPENFPPIDILLLSHDHYDHMDYPTILALDQKVQFYVVPLGVECSLLAWGIQREKIYPLSWWKEVKVGPITVTLTPGQHFSGRNPLRTGVTLWGGYYLQDGKHSVYYTGDTGYGKHFQEVYEKKGKTDVILTDTAQYNQAWEMSHMNPCEAIQAAEDAQAEWMVPIHWGAFALSKHSWNEPPHMVMENIKNRKIKVAISKIGERMDYDQMECYNHAWWNEVK